MNFNNLGELLKALRQEKGWSQEEACEGICSKKTYSRWETNENVPTLFYFQALSNHFNCDLQAFYKILCCDGSAYVAELKDNALKCLNAKD